MSEPIPPEPHALGRWGEGVAARRLSRSGWRIVERNYRVGRKEVDLVVCQGDVLAFVEVKTRRGRGFGSPESAVTWRKRREIEWVASAYLADHGGAGPSVRFDVVAIEVDDTGRVSRFTHTSDAWRPSR